MKRNILALFFTFSICLLLSNRITLHCIAEISENTETIKIGYIDYGSFIEKNDYGTYTGYGVEILNNISEYTGWQYEYIYGTWEECQQRLENGEIDFVGMAQKTPEREKIYAFSSIPNGFEQTIIYTCSDNTELYYNDYEGLDGKTIGLLKNSFQSEFFKSFAQEHNFSYQSIYYSTEQELANALLTNKIDIMVGGSLALHTEMKVIAKEGADPFYFMTNKNNTEQLEQLNYAMSQIRNENPYFAEELLKKYYGTSVISNKPQFTREELDYIKSLTCLKIGYWDDCYPIIRKNPENDEAEGIAVEIMNKLAESIGISVKYDLLESNTTPIDNLNNGTFDIIIPAIKTGYSAGQDILISNSILDSSISAVTTANSPFLNNKENYHIALIANYKNAEAIIQQYFKTYTPVYKASVDECLDAVQNGEADVYFLNYYIAAYRLKSPFYSNLSINYGHEFSADYVLWTAKNNSTLMTVLNKSIASMDSEYVNNIVNQYTLSDNYKYSLSENIYRNRAVILVSLILIIFILIISVFYTISQRKNVSIMASKNKQLEEATHAKMEFFARMSHDMRTPMNGILGMAALSKDETNIDMLHHNINMIESSGEYMLSLINDTLDMQRIESGKMKLAPTICDAEMFIDNLVAMVKPTAIQKCINFKVTNKNVISGYLVYIDPVRLKQIFINLISNAIKFTVDGGTVELSIEILETEKNILHCKFMVIDNGVGMSEEYIKNDIFSSYSQETNDMTSQYAGSGLGLAITKSLVELMNGKIEVQSELGKGTEFTIYLDIPLVNEKLIEKESEKISNQADNTKNKLKGKRILLCEDHPLNAEISKRLLEKVGCDVIWADNGKKGFETFEMSTENYFDAVLMDIRMPVMDGLQSAKSIRSLQRPDAKNIPIIAMTANISEDDIKNSAEAGMNAHLAKPVNPTALYNILVKSVSKH